MFAVVDLEDRVIEARDLRLLEQPRGLTPEILYLSQRDLQHMEIMPGTHLARIGPRQLGQNLARMEPVPSVFMEPVLRDFVDRLDEIIDVTEMNHDLLAPMEWIQPLDRARALIMRRIIDVHAREEMAGWRQ